MARQDIARAQKLFHFRMITFSLSLILIVLFFIFTYYSLNFGYAVHHARIFFMGFSILVIASIATAVETIIITRTSISLYSGKEFNMLTPQQIAAVIQKLKEKN
ncbi:MAG: hypothetical protein QXZ44_02095 [Ferroplasma sp.]